MDYKEAFDIKPLSASSEAWNREYMEKHLSDITAHITNATLSYIMKYRGIEYDNKRESNSNVDIAWTTWTNEINVREIERYRQRERCHKRERKLIW